jgi:glutamate carboxypeptidase
MTFEITARAAHSGGISAIEELARKVQAIHALTDLDRGITLNVGLVRGGQSVNTVVPVAEGQVDIRSVHPGDRDEVVTRVRAIIDRSFVPGTRARPELRGEFLPLNQTPASERLFELYVDAARASGFAPLGEFTGGCADSGFAAGVGAPTICAVGPVGDRAYTADEYLELDSMVPRAQACARTILRLSEAGL